MLYYALVFLVVAIIAGVLGFGGIAGASAGIAQILFFLFLGVLIWQSADMAWESAESLETSNSIWNPWIWPVKVAIPIAGVLLLLQGLVRIASDIRTVMGLENEGESE